MSSLSFSLSLSSLHCCHCAITAMCIVIVIHLISWYCFGVSHCYCCKNIVIIVYIVHCHCNPLSIVYQVPGIVHCLYCSLFAMYCVFLLFCKYCYCCSFSFSCSCYLCFFVHFYASHCYGDVLCIVIVHWNHCSLLPRYTVGLPLILLIWIIVHCNFWFLMVNNILLSILLSI